MMEAKRRWRPSVPNLYSILNDGAKNRHLVGSNVGTNPKSLNFEHPNFGKSELRTPQTYPKKYRSNSNFRVRTSM